MNINKYGYDRKTRILSIIARNFSYEEIKSNLNVSKFVFLIKAKYKQYLI